MFKKNKRDSGHEETDSFEKLPLQSEWQSNPRQIEMPAMRPEFLDWEEVWYRLDEGRGRATVQGFLDRLPKNAKNTNSQAINQTIIILEQAGAKEKGYLDYVDFKTYYNELPAESWKKTVLHRASLDIKDLPPPTDEQVVFRVWTELVDYIQRFPSPINFDWHKLFPPDYDRTRLRHYTFYRSELVHPQRVNEWLLTTRFVDDLPNHAVIQLLEKAQYNILHADIDKDGYLSYEEFLRYVRAKSRGYAGSNALRRGALAVLPRHERTLQTRRYIEEYSCWPPPLFMILFTLAEIITFIIYAVDMALPTEASGPCPTYSPLVFNPSRRYEAWRFLTYALIHSGWVHLVNNLIVQLLLGVLLELVHTWRVIVIYVAGVAAGCLAHSLYTPYYFLAGASGGVYAVEYAHLGNLLLNWNEMQQPWLQFIVIGVIMAMDLGYAIYDTYTNPETTTGHMAHLGGAMAGILVGVVVLRNLTKEKWEEYCWWGSLLFFIFLISCAIALNIFLPIPEFFPENDWDSITQNREDWMYAHHGG